ncbi:MULTISPECIES: ACT domain-containing protein [unclassified Brevundimonas]|uniref:ACT domain-containing protein n=1 Tax=unclassified Brevundimonas TaxID=2622653 RepID=UPI0025B7D344|nr:MULTISPECIES: ACT domain-containing protein [unclassified Brevundimonas]
MSNTIHIQIDRADGSLQRLIGLVERRGFEIHGMNMNDAGDWRMLALTVASRDGTRCIDNLGRQIDRLFGVRRIESAATSNAA